MRLALDDRLRTRLRQVREQQLHDRAIYEPVKDFLSSEGVVCARCGFANASFVGLDGRVLFWNYGDGHPPEELTDPRSVACVVGWLAESAMPELLEALPPLPPGVTPCPACLGRRWASRGPGKGKNGARQLCQRCHGQGWIPE